MRSDRKFPITAVKRERAELAAQLSQLTADQWEQPSLCGEWTVEEVVAHLTAAASIGPLAWMRSVLGARFDFDLHNSRRLAEHRGSTPDETLARFSAVIDSSTSTWGPKEAWLGEVVVHTNDIRHPLGLPDRTPVATSTLLAEFYASKNFTVDSKDAVSGLTLVATDGPFRTAESGPRVTGLTIALVMAMAGRDVYCDHLTGDGVAVLRDRIGGQSV